MKITMLRTYPIKGMRGVNWSELNVEDRGLIADRRWMLVDSENQFITQRTMASLAMIRVKPVFCGLSIELLDGKVINVAEPDGLKRINASVWGDLVYCAVADETANTLLSNFLGKAVRLVHMDSDALRLADPDFAGQNKAVSFADGFPILITAETSLSALNAHIEARSCGHVSMDRFRANIVIDGKEAWDEDSWAVLQIGEVIFDAVKPCARCAVTTKDQETGIGRDDNQSIRALTQIRRSADKNVRGVLFGVNLVPRNLGRLAVGSAVKVLHRRSEKRTIDIQTEY